MSSSGVQYINLAPRNLRFGRVKSENLDAKITDFIAQFRNWLTGDDNNPGSNQHCLNYRHLANYL